jgi:DNA phosphorothioation-dependent restriction protein DptG
LKAISNSKNWINGIRKVSALAIEEQKEFIKKTKSQNLINEFTFTQNTKRNWIDKKEPLKLMLDIISTETTIQNRLRNAGMNNYCYKVKIIQNWLKIGS